jgi:hypothetical protein
MTFRRVCAALAEDQQGQLTSRTNDSGSQQSTRSKCSSELPPTQTPPHAPSSCSHQGPLRIRGISIWPPPQIPLMTDYPPPPAGVALTFQGPSAPQPAFAAPRLVRRSTGSVRRVLLPSTTFVVHGSGVSQGVATRPPGAGDGIQSPPKETRQLRSNSPVEVGPSVDGMAWGDVHSGRSPGMCHFRRGLVSDGSALAGFRGGRREPSASREGRAFRGF